MSIETPAAEAPRAVEPLPRKNTFRNYVAYAALLACLVAVHYIIALNPLATRSVAQASVFSWLALAIIGVLGLLGVVFLNLTPLRGFWDADLNFKTKISIPFVVGLVIGVAVAVSDIFTGWSAIMAAQMHLPTIHIAFPLSVPIYFGGAILVTILYFLILLPFVDWLIAIKLLKGESEPLVFWLAAIPLALVEPITQGDFTAIPNWGWMAVPTAVGDVILNFIQVGFMRSTGFIAAVAVRVGFYAVWHVLYGLF
jgi:hypothetical protein